MDPSAASLPPSSQDSSVSHFALLEPSTGDTLYGLEVSRREALRRRGRVGTGCREIDDAVLVGGFERGAVVGVSAEEGEFGVLVGLQTVARALVFGNEDGDGGMQKAAVITTLPPAAILPTLRDVVRAQAQAKMGPTAGYHQQEVDGEVRRCLEQISVSRVFDVEGLWEVISELETPPQPSVPRDEEIPPPPPRPACRRSVEDYETASKPSELPPKTERMEVGDSEEDEEDLSLSPLLTLPQPQNHAIPSALPSLRPPILPPSAPVPATVPTVTPLPTSQLLDEQDKTASHIPDLILITHFSSLLTNLFTRHTDNKASAHSTLQLLSSHLRYLSRSSSGPLIMLLNTTTSTFTPATTSASATRSMYMNPTTMNTTSPAANRPLEPTLRSIFNSAPPPPPHGAGGGGGRAYNSEARYGGGGSSSRRHVNKPAFGVTFAQFLDLHLLCTRVPRTKSDAEALFAPPYSHTTGTTAATAGYSSGLGYVRYCWVVEVLLDELGAWEWEGGIGIDGAVAAPAAAVAAKGRENKASASASRQSQGKRWIMKSREQRWAAVDVRAGVKIVDAFPSGWQETRHTGPVRVVAGFGGPPPRGL